MGCAREIRVFFACYIVMNFFLSFLRLIATKIRVSKLKKEALKRIEKMKKFNEKKDEIRKQNKVLKVGPQLANTTTKTVESKRQII